MAERVNAARLRDLANAASRWRQPTDDHPDGVPWAPIKEWMDACLMPEPDVELVAECSPEAVLALLDAKERADHLREVLERIVKYGDNWMKASPDNERFRRNQMQVMIEAAASALEREDA